MQNCQDPQQLQQTEKEQHPEWRRETSFHTSQRSKRYTIFLKPDGKVLLHLKLTAHDHQPKKKEIYRHHHPGVGLDLCPGLLHLRTPVDIVKHQHGRPSQMPEEKIEILQRRLIAVIAIHKRQINRPGSIQQWRQDEIKIPLHYFDPIE